MDITLQMRSIELLVKFLRHDLKDVPSYGYALQKPPARESASRPLPRATPEELGMSSAALERLFREMEAAPSTLAIHGAIVLRHGRVAAEGYFAPYRAGLPHMLYSMSKTFTGTAVGFAVDEGLLNVNERVADIFRDITTPGQQKALKTLAVRHLLTMSSGSRFNEVGSMLDKDWVRMFLESAPKFDPGLEFEYNSLNSYMLAAILRRRTGMSLCEYLTPRLFEPLGIDAHDWETCPLGVEKGGWGLSLTLEDCAKLGQLYLQGGVWEGRRLLSREWIEQATAKQIDTPNGELKDGYGYQIWLNRDGYQFNGAFGQYVLVFPALDVVVAILSGSPNLFAEGSLMEMLRASFWIAEDAPQPPNPVVFARMERTLSSLRYLPALPPGDWNKDPAAFARILALLDGREYKLESNTGGLFPQTLQAVHGNYTLGTDMVRFRRGEGILLIDLYEGYWCNTIAVGPETLECTVAMRAEQQYVGTRAVWSLEADEDVRLCVTACFLETPNTRILTFDLRQNAIRVAFDEAPAVLEGSRMLMQLVGYTETAFVKRMATGMKKLPGMNEESVAELMHRFTRPLAEGSLIRREGSLCLPCPYENAPLLISGETT